MHLDDSEVENEVMLAWSILFARNTLDFPEPRSIDEPRVVEIAHPALFCYILFC